MKDSDRAKDRPKSPTNNQLNQTDAPAVFNYNHGQANTPQEPIGM